MSRSAIRFGTQGMRGDARTVILMKHDGDVDKGNKKNVGAGNKKQNIWEGNGRVEEFECDKPFVFFVRHVKSGLILFVGKLMVPN